MIGLKMRNNIDFNEFRVERGETGAWISYRSADGKSIGGSPVLPVQYADMIELALERVKGEEYRIRAAYQEGFEDGRYPNMASRDEEYGSWLDSGTKQILDSAPQKKDKEQ